MPVYIIRSGDRGPVKIGYAASPYDRLAALQTGHFEQLSVVRLLDGGVADERALHRRFSGLRMRGEWFSFCPSMMDDIGLVELPLSSKAGCVPMSVKELKEYAAKKGVFVMTAYRDSRGITQAELAAELSVTQSTVARWESGAMPARDMLARIAELTRGQVMPNDWLDIPTPDAASQDAAA